MTAPARSTEWPVEVRRYLTAAARDRLLDMHGGWQGLALWLYAGGQTRPDGQRLPMAPTLDQVWPYITADAAAFEQSRTFPLAPGGQA